MRAFNTILSIAFVLAHAGPALATDAASWPAAPSRLALETPYGNLQVSASDYVYESYLLLDNQPIEPQVKGLLNIPYAFSSTDFHIALISIDTGDKACPFHYKWITLDNNGYTVTPRFGSCSDKIRVDADKNGFLLLTPSVEQPDMLDRYQYDGETITLQTIPVPEP